MDKGILYGVGVGPGDPELLTIKALKVIKDCDVIALPVAGTADKKQIIAYQIAGKAYPEIDKKMNLFLSMPMTKDKKALRASTYGRCRAGVQEIRQRRECCISYIGRCKYLFNVPVHTETGGSIWI